LKNELEMMHIAYNAKKYWVGLTDEDIKQLEIMEDEEEERREREEEEGELLIPSPAIHHSTTSIQFAVRHNAKILYLFLWFALLKRHRLDSTPILCIATNSLSSSSPKARPAAP
jgi:hypothetical protein